MMNKILSGLVAVGAVAAFSVLGYSTGAEPDSGVVVSKRMTREEALARIQKSGIAPEPGSLVSPVMSGDLEMVEALLVAGADPNGDTGLPKSVLRLAMGTCAAKKATPADQLKLVDLLLSHGALPNEKAPSELSALMVAAQWCSADIVHRLVKAGADIEFKTSLGQSPLVMAFIMENYGAAEALIEKGARLSPEGAARLLKDKEGDAKRVELLKRAQAK
jgi:hypothetical protein